MQTKYFHIAYLSGTLLLVNTMLFGQQKVDSTIKTQHIDIYQTYKPEVSKATKTQVTPTLPSIDTVKPVFKYEVPEQTLNYTYKSIPLRPLAMGIEEDALPFDSYVAAGYGNFSSILFDAGIAKLKGDQFQTAIHGKHLSQNGGGIVSRRSSMTDVSAKGAYQLDAGKELFGGVDFGRIGVTHYGGIGDTVTTDAHIDSLKHSYTNVQAFFGFKNTNTSKWLYAPQVGLQFYGDNQDATEQTFHLAAPIAYQIQEDLKVGFDIEGQFSKFRNFDTTYWNNRVVLHPYLKYNGKWAKLNVGFKPTWGMNNVFYVLPDLKLKAILSENAITIHGGWTGDLIRNSFFELTNLNPFMNNRYFAQQTKAQRVYGGLDFSLGKHMTVGGTIAWHQWNHFSQFVNDYTTTADGKYFNNIYDEKVQAISLDAYFKYQVAEFLSVTGTGTWYNFSYKNDYDKVFHQPKVKLTGGLTIVPIKNLDIVAGIEFWDGMYRLMPNKDIEKMPAFVDLSIKANYGIIPRLSVFLQLNNILNQEYARWNQYHVFGFNAIGGIRFKF